MSAAGCLLGEDQGKTIHSAWRVFLSRPNSESRQTRWWDRWYERSCRAFILLLPPQRSCHLRQAYSRTAFCVMIPSYLGIWLVVQREDQVTGPIPKVTRSAISTASTLVPWQTSRSSERNPPYPAGPRPELPPFCLTPHPETVRALETHPVILAANITRLWFATWLEHISKSRSTTDRWNQKSHFLLPGGWLGIPAIPRPIRTLALGSRRSGHLRLSGPPSLHRKLTLAENYLD